MLEYPQRIAGTPEEVAGVRELRVGPVELAGDRVDEPEARERHADPTALPQAAAQLERALQRGPRRVEVSLGELQIGAAHQHGGEATVFVGGRLGLVGELARPCELSANPGDACLVHENVAHRRPPRQLLERLEGLLEEEPRADRPPEAGPAELGDVERRGNSLVGGDEPEQIAAPCEALLCQAGLAEKELSGTFRVDAERLGPGRPVLGGELERPARPRQRGRAVVPGDGYVREALEPMPFDQAIADRDRDLEAFFDPGVQRIRQAAAQVDRRRRKQCLGAKRGRLRRARQGRGEAPLGLDQVDAPQPERCERSAQAQGAAGVAGEKGVERRAHVRRLAVEELRVGRRLGKGQRPVGVPRRERLRLTGVLELARGVQPHGLEQPVAAVGPAVVEADERLLDEASEHVGDLRRLEEVACADRLGGAELEPAREDAEAAEEDALVGLEEIVAPAERRLERLLPRRRLARPRAKQAEAIVEPRCDRRRGERADAAGCELEREREPIEPEADARDVFGVLGGELEPLRDRRGPLDEQAHGLVAGESDGVRMGLGVGDREGGDAEHDLAGDAKRLAARREHGEPGSGAEELGRERGDRCEHVLAVVENEEQLPSGEKACDGVLEALVGESQHVEGRRDCDRDRGGPRRGELDECRPIGVGPLHRPRDLQAESRLARAAGSGEREEPAAVEER